MTDCKNCGSKNTYLYGVLKNEGKTTEVYDCKDCHKRTSIEVV